MHIVDDKDALRLLQQNNEQAISTLIKKYSEALFSHIFCRIKNKHDTQEIIQNIFISVWKNRQTIVINDSFKPYLFASAKYEVINWLLKNKTHIQQKSLLTNQLQESSLKTEPTIFLNELSYFFVEEIEKMPANMKKIFLLSREKNLTVIEIADQLNLSSQTVKNNISAALRRLQIKYKRYVALAMLVIICLH